MPKTIESSVGHNGQNVKSSVMTVQYLLNCVPAAQGGPEPELAVDGIVGPRTIAAIKRFQARKVGFADGRVDPGGKTLAALGAFDPYPNQPMSPTSIAKIPIPPAPFGGSAAKTPARDPFGKTPGTGSGKLGW